MTDTELIGRVDYMQQRPMTWKDPSIHYVVL